VALGVAAVRDYCLLWNLLALEEGCRILENTFLLGDCLGMLAALRPRRSVLQAALSIEGFAFAYIVAAVALL
jgi:hypothetical protein